MARLTLATALTTPPLATRKTTQLARKVAELSATKSAAEKALKIAQPQLLAAIEAEGEVDAEGKLRLETDDYRLLKVEGESVSIDEGLLLQLGVKPSIIAKARKRKPYAYPMVRAKQDQPQE